jgi:Mechanosensitive ion channel
MPLKSWPELDVVSEQAAVGLAARRRVGLAISFGSQTLVRDIVSGIFYLGDDAFRVGKYIDCGRANGSVEGFTLRSIRLRHQNGQIHTIPFGSLGQITNFRWPMSKELRVRPAQPVEPVSRTLGLMNHPLEFAACPSNDLGIDPRQGRTQPRRIEVTVVGDPAANRRVVHRG